ncbi:MAG: nitroreductase family deazaflavin-dependent oxidoreductase [Chloroflexota bacterium]
MAIPFARQVAVFNKHVTNRIFGPVSWYLPSFGRIEHVGRTSGRRYAAPMMAFRGGDRRHLTFALTYGPEASWVRNALAAGEVVFDSRRGGRLHLVEPRVIHDPQRQAMPWLVRRVLAVMHVDDFLEATIAGTGPGSPPG